MKQRILIEIVQMSKRYTQTERERERGGGGVGGGEERVEDGIGEG